MSIGNSVLPSGAHAIPTLCSAVLSTAGGAVEAVDDFDIGVERGAVFLSSPVGEEGSCSRPIGHEELCLLMVQATVGFPRGGRRYVLRPKVADPKRFA
jgi:hypothetical protein